MAKRSSRSTERDANATAERIRDLNDGMIDLSRRAGLGSLDLYERTLKSIADLQQSVGEASRLQWFAQICATQADFTREFAETYTATAREFLKA